MTSKTKKTTTEVRTMALEFTKILTRDASNNADVYKESQIKVTTEIMETILSKFPEPEFVPSINDVLESMLTDIESLDMRSKHLILQVSDHQSMGNSVAQWLAKHHELMNELKQHRLELINLLNK